MLCANVHVSWILWCNSVASFPVMYWSSDGVEVPAQPQVDSRMDCCHSYLASTKIVIQENYWFNSRPPDKKQQIKA